MEDVALYRLRCQQLEALVQQAVPAVRGVAKRTEKRAAHDHDHAPKYFLMHLDKAVQWRGWLNQAEALIPNLSASMAEDFLEDFHNRDDLAEIERLQQRVRQMLRAFNQLAAQGIELPEGACAEAGG